MNRTAGSAAKAAANVATAAPRSAVVARPISGSTIALDLTEPVTVTDPDCSLAECLTSQLRCSAQRRESDMQFGVFTVGDVTQDPTTGRVPTDAERVKAMTTIALKA